MFLVDPYETNNIALSDPTNFNMMKAKLTETKNTTIRAIDSSTSSQADPDLYGGVWSPGFCPSSGRPIHEMILLPVLISFSVFILIWSKD